MKKHIYYYLEDNGQSSTKLDYNKTFHKLDGPAIEYPNGTKEWFYKGKFLEHISSQKQYEKYLKLRVFW